MATVLITELVSAAPEATSDNKPCDKPDDKPNDKIDAVVVDTIGMLRHLYALSTISIVGGSLVNRGGHNPLEPAAYAKPILFGPDMRDFKEISRMLLDSKGAVQVEDADSLYATVSMLLEDPKRANALGAQAYHLFRANKGAVEKTVTVLESCIRPK
jgi:3-deoxy-D-manno-octulosonic-acid transferase